MMSKLKILVGALALAVVLPVAGFAQVDFSRYVAIGDSLTAGFQSGGLAQTGQLASYPRLLYIQATGSATGFEQPTVSDPGIPPVLELRSLSPLVIAPKAGQGAPINLQLPRPYNNLAVPGARVRDVLVTVTGGLHDLVLRGIAPALQQAVSLNPTFATVWIGNNDVLAAATSGVVIEGVTLTPVNQFEMDFRAIVAALAQTGAELALANIPDVTTIPFVTTIPPVVINPQTNQPVLINGNPVPLIGPNGPLGAGDRVLLPAGALLAQGTGIPAQLGGSGQPLPDTAVLSASEVAAISARVTAYNNIIRAVAQERNTAFVDINALLNEAARTGYPIGGVTFTPAFLTGGIFSYDGVHPTRIGSAIVANAFIEAINRQYGSEIPLVNLYPFLFGFALSQTAQAAVAAPTGRGDVLGLGGVGGGGADGGGSPTGAALLFTPEAKKNLFEALRIDPDPQPKRRPRGKR